jgi:glycine cleavage system aminomethyltransferase T/glycine/D-amino acid oxidase-like deaminating enzyme
VERARAVVIGGGITGVCVALHLARAGITDVVLVEKGELTSGATCQAAGLVTNFNPSPAMMRLRSYSIELYRELGVFETVGGLRLASTPDSLAELRRGVSRARGIGLEAEIIGPAEAVALLPAATERELYGAVWMPRDGHLDPHSATYAVAAAARALGVSIRTQTRVTGIDLDADRAVRAVVTEAGPIECEIVINAAGMWAPRISAMVGAFTPSIPVDHQHIAVKPVAGHELPRDMPCFRDPANLTYGKSESGGMMIGGYEGDAPSRWEDGAPWEHGGRSLPADEERFAPLMDGAVRRFPFLDGAGIAKLVCHPDAMTPDANPLLGPYPGIRGYWLAAGLSLNGFGGAGGIGKTIAELITTGTSEVDVSSYRPWRFAPVYRDPLFAAATARETYRYYYYQRYPFDADEWGRPRRLSALHGRMQEAGAVFGTKTGWERVDHVEPGRPARRSGADQRAFGFARPPWFEHVGAEHAAFRERAGIIDMTSFGKIAVEGADALALLERACCNRIDRAVGAVVYTQMLDARGGVLADVTVTRLAEDRFRVVTGAGAVAADRGHLVALIRRGERVTVRDETDDWSVIGLWGPRARDILQGATDDDVSAAALAFRMAHEIAIGPGRVLAQRITYVGELGYEFYVSPRHAVQVYDRLWAAGAAHGLAVCGYRSLEGLRMEKGYRYIGTDLTPGDTPHEAGLSFCVAEGKDFVGAGALRERPVSKRIRTLYVGDGGEYRSIYGGEAVHAGDAVAGRLRSVAYGYTVGRNLAYAYLDPGVAEGTRLAVDVFGELVPAEVAPDVLYDPENGRVRA